MCLSDKHRLGDTDVVESFPSLFATCGTVDLDPRLTQADMQDRHSTRFSPPVVPDVLEEVEGLL